MLTSSNECSNPKIYVEFVNSFLTYKYNSSTKSTYLNIDLKIVEEIKEFLNNSGTFNAPNIYNKSFGPSFRQAISDLTPTFDEKGRLFLSCLYDKTSTIHHVPNEIISMIFKLFYFQPTAKDFQCYFFKKIDLENLNVKRAVIKQITFP